jgi:sporulation protein YlmC with PRC-barrel domain
VRELRGEKVAARDGLVGSVDDVYFDDGGWGVRYLAVDTGRWLPGRRLLVPPASVETALSSKRKIRLALTREQLEAMPTGARVPGGRLRSGSEVIGYGIEARDGAIGQVQDFVVDDRTWAIHDVVVDTMKWWPGGHVCVHPPLIRWRARKRSTTASHSAAPDGPVKRRSGMNTAWPRLANTVAPGGRRMEIASVVRPLCAGMRTSSCTKRSAGLCRVFGAALRFLTLDEAGELHDAAIRIDRPKSRASAANAKRCHGLKRRHLRSVRR